MGAKKKKKKREVIILACTTCKARNYISTKNRQAHPERQEFKKFCPECNARTMHKESK